MKMDELRDHATGESPRLERFYWVATCKRTKVGDAAKRANHARAAEVRALLEHGAGDLGSTECGVRWRVVSTRKMPQSLI